MRKVIHIDMDAFYASVEQRDRPDLRGRPVVVAWRGPRSVVCAASYEARRFSIRAAMPAVRAERLCPDATFVAPDFARYRAASRAVREIFARYTDLIEPLSLDEAHLDVTHCKLGPLTATRIAQRIRADIARETGLTASAGVAPNKFLAKIASDWRKPNGLFVIQPHEVEDFLAPLPVARLPGVGPATERALHAFGIDTISELRVHSEAELLARFGRFGRRLHELARGVDEHPVCPNQPLRQVSVEDTFPQDLPLASVGPLLAPLAERTWRAACTTERRARTVVVKLKTSDFRILTRSITPPAPPASLADVNACTLELLARVDLPPATRFRLAGVALTNFLERDAYAGQRSLF